MANKRKRRANEPTRVAAANEPAPKKSKPDTNGKNASGKKANGTAAAAAAPAVDTEKLFADHSLFSQDPSAEGKRREVNLYNYLGSESESERVKAANAIVKGLLSGDGVPESVLDRHLDRKLFRGLASGRNASRLGFSLVISEIAHQLYGEPDLANKQYRGLHFNWLLKSFLEKTTPHGNLPGQEERDHYLGQLFGIQGFIQSKVLFDDEQRWTTILDLLLQLAQKKVWMRPQCGWTIVQAIPQMSQKTTQTTLQKIVDAGLAKTAEGLGIWIVATDLHPDMKAPKPWREPLASKTFQELPAVLKENSKGTNTNAENAEKEKGQKQANWTAQLHFVWDLILAHFVKLVAQEEEADGEKKDDLFDLFWNSVVDQAFFSKGASDSQKFTGFMIFHKMLEAGADHHFILQSIFSKNLMACLINQAAKEDRYLHRAATKAIKSIERITETHTAILPIVLDSLLNRLGVYNFDERTKTKLVDKILQHADGAGDADEILDILKTATLAAGDSEDRENRLRIYGDYISKLASSPAPSAKPNQESLASVALGELACLAYAKSDSSLSIADKTRQALRTRLTSAFAKLIRRPEDFPRLCQTVLSIDYSEIDMDEEIEAELVDARERMQQLLKPAKKKSKKATGAAADSASQQQQQQQQQGPSQALALLHAVAILQLYNGEADAIATLEDLKQCHEKLRSKQADESSGLSEVLVEILLSLVARPSLLMKQVSHQVFGAFAHIISAEGLGLLTDTLTVAENAKGQKELFNTDGDEGGEEGAGEDGDEDTGRPDVMDVDQNGDDDEDEISELGGADIELLNGMDEEGEGNSPSQGEDDNDNGNDDDDDDDDEDEDEEELRKLEALDADLTKILGTRRLDKDKDVGGGDDDDDAASFASTSSDMDDDDMMQLDEKLSQAFQHRASEKKTNKNKEHKDAKETVVNFKNRVLDLLDIYARDHSATATNPLLAFSILVPLLQLMGTTKTKPLANRAHEIINNLSKAMKKARGTASNSNSNGDKDADDDAAEAAGDAVVEAEMEPHETILRAIHALLARDDSHQYARAASTASLTVATHLHRQDAARGGAAVDAIYHETQVRWHAREVKVQTGFFVDWLNWCQSHGIGGGEAGDGKKEVKGDEE